MISYPSSIFFLYFLLALSTWVKPRLVQKWYTFPHLYRNVLFPYVNVLILYIYIFPINRESCG